MQDKMETKSFNNMAFNGKCISQVIRILVTSLNQNKMMELDFAWKQMVEQEFHNLKKKYSQDLKTLFRDIEARLPLSKYDLLTE
mmetsp:Transcript_30144/g.65922  ORF Transcript_30144/g.65922 Transcript_30144/m.65922 type:complete len:84 (+) Transcript_30144:872-1123(+)